MHGFLSQFPDTQNPSLVGKEHGQTGWGLAGGGIVRVLISALFFCEHLNKYIHYMNYITLIEISLLKQNCECEISKCEIVEL